MKYSIILYLICAANISAFAQFRSYDPLKGESPEARNERIKNEDNKYLASKRIDISNPQDPPRYYEPRQAGTVSKRNAKEDAKRLMPDKEDFAKYYSFLKQGKTGLIKLFAHADCLLNPEKYIIRVDDPCMNELPLSGYYSFRKKDYSPKLLSDLILIDENFYTKGEFANSIIVNLGDTPIESLTLNSNGMQLLTEFPAATKKEEVSDKSKQLKDGIKVGDYFYSDSSVAAEKKTYAIRVIAYRSPFDAMTDRLNPYSYDKRADIIVAFRVVRKDAEGNLTLLWKELQRKSSPKIKDAKFDIRNYLKH